MGRVRRTSGRSSATSRRRGANGGVGRALACAHPPSSTSACGGGVGDDVTASCFAWIQQVKKELKMPASGGKGLSWPSHRQWWVSFQAPMMMNYRVKDEQLLTVDRWARGSMKTAAKCVSACESQDYQMHRPVERTLRRRHCPVSSPLPDECLHTQQASIPDDGRPRPDRPRPEALAPNPGRRRGTGKDGQGTSSPWRVGASARVTERTPPG